MIEPTGAAGGVPVADFTVIAAYVLGDGTLDGLATYAIGGVRDRAHAEEVAKEAASVRYSDWKPGASPEHCAIVAVFAGLHRDMANPGANVAIDAREVARW